MNSSTTRTVQMENDRTMKLMDMTTPFPSMFSLTDHELYVVTARHQGKDLGQIATWIMPATLVPNSPRLIAVLSVSNATQQAIEVEKRFCVQMLARGQESLLPRFGLQSSRDSDKFEGLNVSRTPGGLALLEGVCGWMECRVLAGLDSGDRITYLAEAEFGDTASDRLPLHKREAFALSSTEVVAALMAKHHEDGIRDAALIKRHFPTQ